MLGRAIAGICLGGVLATAYAYALQPLTVSILQLPMTLALVVGSLLSLTGAAPVTVAFNIALVVVGFGAGAASVAQSQILITEAPPEFVGPVAASRTTFGQIGYAIGLAGSAVVTTMLTIWTLGTGAARTELDTLLTASDVSIGENPTLPVIADAYTNGSRPGCGFGPGCSWWAPSSATCFCA